MVSRQTVNTFATLLKSLPNFSNSLLARSLVLPKFRNFSRYCVTAFVSSLNALSMTPTAKTQRRNGRRGIF